MTVDYRNERLILEPQSKLAQAAKFESQIEAARSAFLQSGNLQEACTSLQRIAAEADADKSKAGEALAKATEGLCYISRYEETKDKTLLDKAREVFRQANEEAEASGSDRTLARVLAANASLYLQKPVDPAGIIAAQTMLTRAVSLNPVESTIYSTLGCLTQQAGQLSIAMKMLDQALLLDPANWDALCAKYQAFHSQGKAQDERLVLSQMKHYYPQAALVAALNRPAPPAPKPHPAAGKAPAAVRHR